MACIIELEVVMIPGLQGCYHTQQSTDADLIRVNYYQQHPRYDDNSSAAYNLTPISTPGKDIHRENL